MVCGGSGNVKDQMAGKGVVWISMLSWSKRMCWASPLVMDMTSMRCEQELLILSDGCDGLQSLRWHYLSLHVACSRGVASISAPWKSLHLQT